MLKGWVNIRVCQEISSNDTLIIVVIIKDNALDHMLSESRLDSNKEPTVGEGVTILAVEVDWVFTCVSNVLAVAAAEI
uniref:Uncharacterized protein n=1 Tax=Romanomermis culicivorax TaxID=13658 RepID=A0A915JZP4_ROMCU